MVTVCYSRLQQVTEWLLSGYCGLQQVTSGFRVVTVGYRRLQLVREGYSRLTSGYSGLQQVTAGYRVNTVRYSRLQKFTDWLQWVTAGYSGLPSCYSGLQQVTELLQ